MPRVTFEELLEAGVHFGHLKRKWNPAMAPYIFMERNGIHIIDLEKTIEKLEEAASAMKHIARSGKKILFVATKKQAKEIVAERAKKVNMPYVTERWPGGMLTNFPTIRKAVKKMASIDKMLADGTFANLSKREKLQITRQRAKLEKLLGSIADMTRLPSAIFVVDVCKENIAVREAKRLGIPVFAMVDTNSDPSDIDFPIPANDDASKSIAVIVDVLCKAIEEGLNERKLEKDKEVIPKDKKEIRKELETQAVPDSIIDVIVSEDEEIKIKSARKSLEMFEEEFSPEHEILVKEEIEESEEEEEEEQQES
ncbi:MAG TPA: 30S ribosomal protein S2 [Bacteroidales bacterium]|nr:30S ribosomal protein S2 [Bacteroidales bacterium]HOK73930.1 30S ribosomal protein S2 [Bacteroidales bacterium]HOM39559.1 30S ribosomal protein S2 [Bacteroidales bacterium]HPP91941.1 30S ribosomal protein S2 [Bacteroidales bacterium]HQG55430.1 30S ribosomal protein S2 [Bacteroidales bacterium]